MPIISIMISGSLVIAVSVKDILKKCVKTLLLKTSEYRIYFQKKSFFVLFRHVQKNS